jgi:hypothetical protein
MNPEEAVTAIDATTPAPSAFIKDGTVTDVLGATAVVDVDGGGVARPTILGVIPTVGQRVTLLFDPAANGTCVVLGAYGGFSVPTIDQAYPVGSVYMSYLSTDPSDASMLGFGTWVRIAEGEAVVGFKSADTPFGTVGSIGAAGEKTHSLSSAENGAHTHTGGAHTHTGPDHAHTGPTGSWFHYVTSGGSRADGGTGTGYDRDTLGSTGLAGTGNTSSAGAVATTSSGSGTGHNNIQPSFVVFIWRRTA